MTDIEQDSAQLSQAMTQLQLHKWLRISSLTTLSFGCLLIADNSSLPLLIAAGPFILLDVVIIGCSLRLLCSSHKTEGIKEGIDAFGTLLFKVLQVLYWTIGENYFTVTIVPIVVAHLVRIAISSKDVNQCQASPAA